MKPDQESLHKVRCGALCAFRIRRGAKASASQWGVLFPNALHCFEVEDAATQQRFPHFSRWNARPRGQRYGWHVGHTLSHKTPIWGPLFGFFVVEFGRYRI